MDLLDICFLSVGSNLILRWVPMGNKPIQEVSYPSTTPIANLPDAIIT
jgi:hypothetical protein